MHKNKTKTRRQPIKPLRETKQKPVVEKRKFVQAKIEGKVKQ